MSSRPLNIAVVGAGPAAYSPQTSSRGNRSTPGSTCSSASQCRSDLSDTASPPDHPRIKAIIDSLHNVLDRRDIRLVAGIEVGTHIGIHELQSAYDAVILTTGANDDAPLPIPGIDLPGSFGLPGSCFGTSAPRRPTEWDLNSTELRARRSRRGRG